MQGKGSGWKLGWLGAVTGVLFGGCSAGNSVNTADSADAAAPPAVIEPASLGPTVDVRTAAQVMEQGDVLVIDVREQWEYDQAHIPGVVLMPMNTVPARLNEIPRDREVILTCRSGNRSGQVTEYLRQQGFTNVHNMSGGILAWQKAGLAVER